MALTKDPRASFTKSIVDLKNQRTGNPAARGGRNLQRARHLSTKGALPGAQKAQGLSRSEQLAAEEKERLKSSFEGRREELGKTFDTAREIARNQSSETSRQVRNSLARQKAITGGAGGAFAKLGVQAEKELGKDLFQQGKELSVAQGQAEQALSGEQSQQQFAAAQTQIAQALQNEQFQKKFDFEKDSFYAQLDFNFQELAENKKTNWINTQIALRDAGFDNPDDWRKVLENIEVTGTPPGIDVDTELLRKEREGVRAQRSSDRRTLERLRAG